MSVDFSPFINLRIYDKDPGQVYLTALEIMKLNVPQLSIRPGTIEDAMLQAFAFVSTIAINHINALPNRLVEGIANLMGTQRVTGTYASVTAMVTALDYAGGSLESGTIFQYTYTNSGVQTTEYYELTTSVTIDTIEPDLEDDPPTPLPSTEVLLTAIELGQRKAIPEDALLVILNSQSVADSAVALSTFSQGVLPEDDAQFLSRFATQLQSMSNVLTTAKQIESYLLSKYTFISRAKAYDLTDGDLSSDISYADQPGFVTVYVYGDERPLSSFERATVYKDLSETIMAGLQVVVKDITILKMVINAEVKIKDGSNYPSTISAIETSLLTLFSPSSYPMSDGAIRKSTVFSQLNTVGNVVYTEQSMTMTCEQSTSDGANNLIFDNKGCLPLIDIGDSTILVTYL